MEWCAIFVSWCAEQCGYLDAGIIPKTESVVTSLVWFQQQGRWADGFYTPSPGDIIFFDWEPDGSADHVGIVEYVEDGYIHAIEGNSSNSVNRNSYQIGTDQIVGYGIPDYDSLTEDTTSEPVIAEP